MHINIKFIIHKYTIQKPFGNHTFTWNKIIFINIVEHQLSELIGQIYSDKLFFR